MNTTSTARLLRPTDLAERFGVSPSTLAKWRHEGRGPVYVKLRGAIRYRAADVEAYENEHLVGAR